jgi:hypothetical protein
MSRHKIPSDQIVVVSRGGAESWYKGICGRYVDVFDFYDQAQYKALNDIRIATAKTQKHNEIDEFDNAILEKVMEATGIKELSWLHPSYMYRLFRLYWRGDCPISFVGARTRFQSLIADAAPEDLVRRLPDRFVAVKFYFSACFPDTTTNRQFAAQLLRSLAQESDVVLLSTGLTLDDHSDLGGALSERIHTFEDLMSPRNNLALQTAIISRASAFFGTYGGFSYLAPIFGVPSVAFYSDEDKFLPVHLETAYRASRFMKFGAFNKVKLAYNQKSGGIGMNSREFVALNVRSLETLGRAAGSRSNDLKAAGLFALHQSEPSVIPQPAGASALERVSLRETNKDVGCSTPRHGEVQSYSSGA